MAQKVRGVYEQPKGSGIWWCQHFTPNRTRERVGRKTDAIALYQKRRADYRAGLKLPELRPKRILFGELLDDAITFAKENHKQPRDIQSKAKILRPVFGNLPVEAVTSEAIAAWIKARKVSPATQNRYKAFFSLCFREAAIAKKVTTNPAKLVRRKKEPEGRKRYLSRKEYDELLGHVTAPRHPQRRIAVIVSVLTGMRLMEQFTLDWTQIDFDRNEINLTRTKNGDGRSIPMLPEVRAALLEQKKATGRKRTNKVFARIRGGDGAVKLKWFDQAVADAEIENYTWHNNRHTFCSWYMLAGGELLELKTIAGHKTLAMTARYAHLSPGHLRAGMKRLAQMTSRPAGELVNFEHATRTAIA